MSSSVPPVYQLKPEPSTDTAGPSYEPGAAVSRAASDIATISDRRVRIVGPGFEDASIYSQCRQWAYNLPQPMYKGPIDEGIKLPPIQHPSEQPQPAPIPEDQIDVGNSELTDIDAILEKQKHRWKFQGQYMREGAVEARKPYIERLNKHMHIQ